MRLPGESTAELNKSETAWRLLAPFGVTPATATLLRSTTYIFQARWADEWRAGHVLLAGDAAHLMPPFAGQGMCSGIRDVVNLAWKLDLTLRGLASESIMDSYTEERRAQAKDAIQASVQLGRVICVTDPAAAAERDTTVLANRRGKPPTRPEPAKPLTCGLLHHSPGAGAVVPQGRVRLRGEIGLFDDVVGRGFVLLTTEAVTLGESFLAELGAHVVRLDDTVDVDEVYLPYLAQYQATSLLVRPDYHVFGSADGLSGLDALVDDLRDQLRAAVPAGAPPLVS
jgi:flavoprotein hydroxylase